MLLRLAAAAAAGGLMGLERQVHGRPAGLRTHILVSAGACMAIVAGLLAAESASVSTVVDAGRIAAGVITGVGFLGAGTIVHYREGVGGLTTAACLWYAAMTGVVCGFGLFLFAAAAAFTALVVLILLEQIEDRLPAAAYWTLKIRTGLDVSSDVEEQWRGVLKEQGLTLKSITVSISEERKIYTLTLRSRFRRDFTDAVAEISSLDGILAAELSHRSGEL